MSSIDQSKTICEFNERNPSFTYKELGQKYGVFGSVENSVIKYLITKLFQILLLLLSISIEAVLKMNHYLRDLFLSVGNIFTK